MNIGNWASGQTWQILKNSSFPNHKQSEQNAEGMKFFHDAARKWLEVVSTPWLHLQRIATCPMIDKYAIYPYTTIHSEETHLQMWQFLDHANLIASWQCRGCKNRVFLVFTQNKRTWRWCNTKSSVLPTKGSKICTTGCPWPLSTWVIWDGDQILCLYFGQV